MAVYHFVARWLDIPFCNRVATFLRTINYHSTTSTSKGILIWSSNYPHLKFKAILIWSSKLSSFEGMRIWWFKAILNESMRIWWISMSVEALWKLFASDLNPWTPFRQIISPMLWTFTEGSSNLSWIKLFANLAFVFQNTFKVHVNFSYIILNTYIPISLHLEILHFGSGLNVWQLYI